MRQAETKVQGGKLVRLQAKVNGDVREVRISGDFFLHPEESIERIEEALVGLSRDAGREEIIKRVENVCRIHKVTMLGFTSDAIADLLLEVLK